MRSAHKVCIGGSAALDASVSMRKFPFSVSVDVCRLVEKVLFHISHW